MRTTLITLVSLLTIVAMTGNALAQEQDASQRTGTVPVEFCDEAGDKEANLPGGPLASDPLQILFTVPPDPAGPPFPIDSQDFGDGDEIDALANRGDAYYSSVKANNADLLVSLDTDPGAPHAVYQEDTLGVGTPLWWQRHLYFEDDGAGFPDDIEDLDGLELWGPWSDETNPLSGWDANIYSLVGDPAGTSVWYYPWGGPAQVLVTQAQIHACASTLGFTGAEEDIDVDALMCSVYQNEIIFSIRAAANWDGGELVVYNWGTGAANWLNHGGHLWDTAHSVAARLGVDTEEVDAIEAARDLVPPPPPEDPPPPPPPPPPFWVIQQMYHNDTGETAYDLTKILSGHVNVVGAIHHKFKKHKVDHVFGLTVIHWYDGTVEPCEWTWACFWGTGPKPTVLAAFWTREDGSIIGRAGPAISSGVGVREGGTFVDVGHDWCEWSGTGYPIEEGDGCTDGLGEVDLTDVHYAITDVWRTMEELNEDLFTDRDIDWIALESGPINYEGTVSYEIPQLAPEDVLLFRFEATEEVQTSREILQYGKPRAIPAVSEWGVVVMVLLVLSAGTIVFRRFRAVAA